MQRTIEKMLLQEEIEWYQAVLRRDAAARKLSPIQSSEIVMNCKNAAEKIKKQLITKYGVLKAREYADLLGIKIQDTIDPITPHYLYMGLYEPDIRRITLNQSTINLIKGFVDKYDLKMETPVDKLEEIVIFHELFHALEEMTPNIYTRSTCISKRFLGLFPRKCKLDSASEVGAVHFSGRMAGTSYSPCIYEQYLLMAVDQLPIESYQ